MYRLLVPNTSGSDPTVAVSASMITREGNLHGVDVRFLGFDVFGDDVGPCVPARPVERILVDGLENFLTVAEHGLGLEADTRFAGDVGLANIKGLVLDVGEPPDRRLPTKPFLVGQMEQSSEVDFYTDPFSALRPFFEKMFDEADQTRNWGLPPGLNQFISNAPDRRNRPCYI